MAPTNELFESSASYCSGPQKRTSMDTVVITEGLVIRRQIITYSSPTQACILHQHEVSNNPEMGNLC
jgi:hypothetical protein